MSVVHMRIDNRLIHGQVTVTWVGSVGANHIIVCNDKVSKDPSESAGDFIESLKNKGM